jgi:hypothetical protein
MDEAHRCDVCGVTASRQEMKEAEIIGRVRTVCEECHQHLNGVW